MNAVAAVLLVACSAQAVLGLPSNLGRGIDEDAHHAALLKQGWTLTWNDEFDGTALNATKWTPRNNMTHGDQTHELELYMSDECLVDSTCGGTDSNTKGCALLRTRPRKLMYGATPYKYGSCWMDTQHKFGQLHGRFEVRAKLPRGKGAWPAHWLMPNTAVCWPVGGEIDIMESWDHKNNPGLLGKPRVSGTYHWAHECGKDQWDGKNGHWPLVLHDLDYTKKFHIFAVEWDSSEIRWYMDDHHFHTRKQGHPKTLFVPTNPMYVILNTALMPGKNAPDGDNPWPMLHYVDYVRVYKRN